MSGLFAPKNLLETCRGAQATIRDYPPGEQDKVGRDFEAMLGQKVDFFGARKLEIRSAEGFGLPDGLTKESELWPIVRYGNLRVMGRLASVQYWNINHEPTILWMTTDPTIRDLWNEIDAIGSLGIDTDYQVADTVTTGRTLRRPLYFPVDNIESVLIAA